MFATTIQNTFKNFARRISNTVVNPKVKIDAQQEAALKERCFLVNAQDQIIGSASKRECHTVDRNGKIPLHRAFSVFLFNTRGDLVLQKRSAAKITYPERYTNSCCSHPIEDVAGENEEHDALGIKRAAQRRMNYELGISKNEMPLEKFKYITRIKYFDSGDGQFGEHEIDYILIFQGNVTINPNPNEISEISLIPKEHMNTFTNTLQAPLTPWFQLILKHNLLVWWRDLGDLDKYVDHHKIHDLKS